jgi:hypothetical protein
MIFMDCQAKEEGATVLTNVGDYIPKDTASYSIMFEPSQNLSANLISCTEDVNRKELHPTFSCIKLTAYFFSKRN